MSRGNTWCPFLRVSHYNNQKLCKACMVTETTRLSEIKEDIDRKICNQFLQNHFLNSKIKDRE